MAREKSRDSANVSTGLKISEIQAARIDEALALPPQDSPVLLTPEMTRPQWIRALVDIALDDLAARGLIGYADEHSPVPGNPLRTAPQSAIQAPRPQPFPGHADPLTSWGEGSPLRAEDLPVIHDRRQEPIPVAFGLSCLQTPPDSGLHRWNDQGYCPGCKALLSDYFD